MEWGPGFNCLVAFDIGGYPFRVCLDTGAARSMMRTKFARTLQRLAKTKDSVVERCRLKNKLYCTGVCEGMDSKLLTHTLTVKGNFVPLDPDGHKPPPPVSLDIEFGELENASDPMLIGFPDIIKWGCKFTVDADGNAWVSFENLGFSVLTERPDLTEA